MADQPTPDDKPPEEDYIISFTPTDNGGCLVKTNVGPTQLNVWRDQYLAEPNSLTPTQGLFYTTLCAVIAAIQDENKLAQKPGGMLA